MSLKKLTPLTGLGDDIEFISKADRVSPGRPKSQEVHQRKLKELQLKREYLDFKKLIHENRLVETEQKERMLQELCGIRQAIEVLTAVMMAQMTAGAALQLKGKL
jgi:hypothetical protein